MVTEHINDRLGPGGLSSVAVFSEDGSGIVTGLDGPNGPVDLVNRLFSPVVLYEGDSITNRVDPAAESFSAVSTSAENIGYNANSYVAWERAELGSCYGYVNNAVNGQTIEQITTRLLATDISSYAVVSLLCGTNNMDNSTAADAAADIALIESVVTYCRDRHKPIRLLTIPPKATVTMDADTKAYILAFNTLLKKLPQKYPNVFVGDAFLGIQDTTSADPAPIAGTIAADNIHPTKKGSFLIAHYGASEAMRDALRYAGYGHILDSGMVYDDETTYTEVLTNADFSTQTGGTDSTAGILTGTVPSGWRLLKEGTPTAVVSQFPFYVPEAKRQRGIWVTAYEYEVGDAVTDSGGAYICLADHTAGATFAGDAANWKRVWSSEYCWQLTVTADAAAEGIYIQRASALSAVTGSDVVMGLCGIAVEGETSKVYALANTSRHFAIEAYTTVGNYALFNMALFADAGETDATVGERFEGIFRTQKSAFQTGGAIGSPQFKVRCTLNAAGTASIIIYKPSLRKYA